MQFIVEINLEKIKGDPAVELGRALRYWGSAAKQIDLAKEQRVDIIASDQETIGYWEVRTTKGPGLSGHQHTLD